MILSLKISFFVYENFSSLNNSEEIAHVIDFEENENEEKKELDENKKIHQIILASSFQIIDGDTNSPSSNLLALRNLYSEFTTPPPELGYYRNLNT